MNCSVCPVSEEWTVPSFSGRSYLQLKKPYHGSRELLIELEFIPLTPNGILLYTGQHASGQGDFLLIKLKNGFVIFR